MISRIASVIRSSAKWPASLTARTASLDNAWNTQKQVSSAGTTFRTLVVTDRPGVGRTTGLWPDAYCGSVVSSWPEGCLETQRASSVRDRSPSFL